MQVIVHGVKEEVDEPYLPILHLTLDISTNKESVLKRWVMYLS